MNYMHNKYIMYDVKIYLIGIKINVQNKYVKYYDNFHGSIL